MKSTQVEELARILVDHSARVQSGQNVVIDASDFSAIELVHACYKLCIERGAHVYLDISGLSMETLRADTGGFMKTFLETASEEQLRAPPALAEELINWGDVFIRILSVHDPQFLASVDSAKLAQWHESFDPIFRRVLDEKTWVLTRVPTEGLARFIGMEYVDLVRLYCDASLVDYDEMASNILAVRNVLDAGNRVHILGPRTDLTLNITDRLAAGHEPGRRNIPDGECFLGPQEDGTEGEIFFEERQVRDGNSVTQLWLRFEKGEVTDWSCETGDNFMRDILEGHPGNRRLGELGIGMNTDLQQYTTLSLFDEKIAGTVHFALGRSYSSERGGGKNDGTIHWDLVKDLRCEGTSITVDDTTILRDGTILL